MIGSNSQDDLTQPLLESTAIIAHPYGKPVFVDEVDSLPSYANSSVFIKDSTFCEHIDKAPETPAKSDFELLQKAFLSNQWTEAQRLCTGNILRAMENIKNPSEDLSNKLNDIAKVVLEANNNPTLENVAELKRQARIVNGHASTVWKLLGAAVFALGVTLLTCGGVAFAASGINPLSGVLGASGLALTAVGCTLFYKKGMEHGLAKQCSTLAHELSMQPKCKNV